MTSIANSTRYQGAKIALLCKDCLVTYLRDDLAHIPDPALWDLPGGVRESDETALACVLRETREEFGIDVPPDTVLHAASYTAYNPTRDVAFFAARIPCALVRDIRYGNEGQEWRMMGVTEFLARTDAVPELQAALNQFLRGVT